MRERYVRLPINIHDNYDHTPIEAPQIPDIAKLVVFPLKTVFVNIFANRDATIVKYFRDLEDFSDFCERVRLDVG